MTRPITQREPPPIVSCCGPFLRNSTGLNAPCRSRPCRDFAPQPKHCMSHVKRSELRVAEKVSALRLLQSSCGDQRRPAHPLPGLSRRYWSKWAMMSPITTTLISDDIITARALIGGQLTLHAARPLRRSAGAPYLGTSDVRSGRTGRNLAI